jgi:hypothetical protein
MNKTFDRIKDHNGSEFMSFFNQFVKMTRIGKVRSRRPCSQYFMLPYVI